MNQIQNAQKAGKISGMRNRQLNANCSNLST